MVKAHARGRSRSRLIVVALLQHVALALDALACCANTLPAYMAPIRAEASSPAGVRVGAWSQKLLRFSLAGHVAEVTVGAWQTQLPCHAPDRLVLRTACKKGKNKG